MNRFRLRTLALALPGLFCIATVLAESLHLHSLQLQHRTAAEIIPIIKPLLVRGGSVTGLNDQLIVKTTAANLSEINHLLQTIDKAARRLIIYVRQDTDRQQHDKASALSGRYATGKVTLSGGGAPAAARGQAAGTRLRATDTDGNTIAYRDQHTRLADSDENLFHVQTVEGRAAFIQTGQSVPFAAPQTIITPAGIIATDSVQYRDITSGFYVLPRLAGEQVTLSIAPQLASLDERTPGIINTQNLATTITGRLGEWLDIGGVDHSSQRHERRHLTSSNNSRRENRRIQLKVVELP